MSGMSKNKKLIWYIIPLIAVIFMNAAVITKEYFEYKAETIRLGSILAEKQQNDISFEEAERTLESYGYNKKSTSGAYRGFLRITVFMPVISLLLYVVIAFSIKKQEKETEKKYNCILSDVERVLTALKDGSYDPLAQGMTGTAYAEDCLDAARLETLIDSLYGKIAAIEENAENDKRETKAVVTDISHQLKTPLAAIKSTFEIMAGGNLSEEERKEFEALMGFQIASLEKLIISLVNISRLESGMIDIKLTEGNLFDAVLDAVNSIWLKADEKNIMIEYEDFDAKEVLHVMYDKKWLTEAFINILDNAVKYSEKDTMISISIMKLGSMYRIEFKDRGPGIPDKEKHSVFKRFYRGTAADSSSEGSGVGLYLARRIISEHNGTIMVKDNVSGGKKQGSVFVVHLPI